MCTSLTYLLWYNVSSIKPDCNINHRYYISKETATIQKDCVAKCRASICVGIAKKSFIGGGTVWL